MMRTLAPSHRRLRSTVAAAAVFAATLLPGMGKGQVARRLFQVPSSADSTVSLPDTLSPRAKNATVLGHLAGETQLSGMSLILKPTDTQAAALQQLLLDQQNPSSPQFHKWLTPQTYAQQFGLADADLAVVQDWLTSKGFTVDSVAPSHNQIVFSGPASAVESAFGTTLERFRRPDQDYFENSTAVSLPQGLAGVVSGITGISSFHMKPPVQAAQSVSPQWTNSTGYHYLVPWDFRQIFGMNTLINAGYDGTGIKIGVIGQSSVSATQIGYFQSKTGQTAKTPTMTLVPNTGSSGQLSAGDEGESELDLEYASGSAPGATVLFIYTGLGNNNGVFDAMIYAVTNNLAPILTLSYGGCEASNASYARATMEPILAQASSQGQTILVSSGDTGAAGCESSSNTTTTATAGLSVSYPASSPNVTAVGGTQLTGTDPNTSSTSWTSSNNSYAGSAVGYIQETSWNDTAAYGSLSASGGGASSIFTKPTWQIGTGVPADSYRDIPDVAFPSAVEDHAYIVCTVSSTCTSTAGFGTNAGGGGLIGGTSAAAPNFAAMLAVVEQATGSTSGLGNINTRLYTLAASSSASSVFHDITTGNNIVNCRTGTTGCTSGTMGYSAGVGYDQVTGLGSIDASGLSTALTASSSKKTPTVNLTAATLTPTSGATDLLTVNVTGTGATPTGTVSLAIDGTTASTVTLASGSGTYTYSVPACTGTSACTHTVVASYSGDATFNNGLAAVTLTVAAKLNPTVNLTAATQAPTGGTNDVLTVSVTGSGATPTGTVALTIDGTTASTITLSSGSGTYTYSVPTCASGCTHSVAAAYSGDTVYNSGSASLTLTVGTVTKTTPTVTVTPATTTVASGGTDVITVKVAGTTGTPSGTVALAIDGTTVSTLTLSSGSSTYTYTAPTCTAVCTHTVVATYSGDTLFNTATSTSVTITVGSAIALSPSSSSLTVKAGSSIANTINVTSTGFAGTLGFTASASPSLSGCYALSPSSPTIASGGTATTTITIYTSSANCTSAGAVAWNAVAANHPPQTGFPRTGLAVAAAGLLGVFALRRRRLAALLLMVVSIAVVGLGGCSTSTGVGSGSTTTTTATTGTYTITVNATGTPASGSTVTASTTYTLIVN